MRRAPLSARGCGVPRLWLERQASRRIWQSPRRTGRRFPRESGCAGRRGTCRSAARGSGRRNAPLQDSRGGIWDTARPIIGMPEVAEQTHRADGSQQFPNFDFRVSNVDLPPCGTWWTRRDSNPRPQRCERRALPAELRAHGYDLSQYSMSHAEGQFRGSLDVAS
jgi:hypothetical protein